jgi:SAM-dependent methyltransferase
VIRADWRDLPVADASFDLVVGDGCTCLLPYPDGYRVLVAQVARALEHGGRFVLRSAPRRALHCAW